MNTAKRLPGWKKTNALLAAGGLLALLGGPSATPVRAQAATASDQTVTLNVENAPVQTVLKTLFTGSGKNYSIAPDVRGTVNVNLSGVSFDVALRSVLRAANPPLTFDLTNNTYAIKVKRDTPPIQPAVAPTSNLPVAVHTYRIPVDHYDAYYIASLVGASRSGVSYVAPNYVNPGPAAGSAGTTNGRGNGRGGNRQGRGGRGGSRGRGY